jgi:hypothetical protein
MWVLVLCLPQSPPPLLTPHLPALLPLLKRALLLQVNSNLRPVLWNRNLRNHNLVEPEPECILVPKPDLDPCGSNIKLNNEVKKSKIIGQLSGKDILTFGHSKGKILNKLFFLLELFQSRNRNCNKSFHNTA